MTRERAKELLPIITAFAEGKQIECRECEGCEWIRTTSSATQLIFHDDWQYRIAPEPFECWGVTYPNGALVTCSSKASAERFASTTDQPARVVLLREVEDAQ